MIRLPNGKSIDLDMLETAMEDSDLANRYFLNLVSGEVVFFSDYLGLSDEDDRLLEEIDGSNDYVAIERIPSHEAYQWMVDFVGEMVAPADEHAAETLSMALNGKGAFRRFKDTLHLLDNQWLQAWYQWRNNRLETALDEWLKSVL
jgi:Uncharacterised protein family (UPF0158)